ncbi:MAG: hypothetical protein ACRDLO_09805 [Solirubrobacterales bacterium]
MAADEETWNAFRRLALERGFSISAYLGRLVAAELKRRKALHLESVRADAPELEQALEALAAVRASIDELDAIASRLARSAVSLGASWKDIASSLRITPGQAETAYGETPRRDWRHSERRRERSMSRRLARHEAGAAARRSYASPRPSQRGVPPDEAVEFETDRAS